MSNFNSTHIKLTCFLNELMANPNNTFAWLCQGSTYLLTIHNMKLLKTNLIMAHTNDIMRSDNQDINCGIFQGDLSVNIPYQHLCSYGINKYMINNNWYWWKMTGFIIRSYGRYRNHWSSVGYISNHIVVFIFIKIIVV